MIQDLKIQDLIEKISNIPNNPANNKKLKSFLTIYFPYKSTPKTNKRLKEEVIILLNLSLEDNLPENIKEYEDIFLLSIKDTIFTNNNKTKRKL